MITNSIKNIAVNKMVYKIHFSSLLVTAVVLCLFGAAFTVTSFAAPSRYESGGECRSQVFDLVTPEDIPSDGKVVKPAQNGPRKTQGSISAETEDYIPLVMIVIGFNGQPYNTTYDWSNRIFEGDTCLSQYYKDMSFGKFTFLPAQENSASGVDGNKSTTDQVNDGIIHVTLSTQKNKGWAISYDRAADLENMIAFANALKLAGNYINFGDYDADGDGMIQNSELAVGFVVAGRDASCSSGISSYKKYYTWPNAYSFSECRQAWKSNLSGFPDVPVIDGVKVDGYIAIAESYETDGKYNSTGKNLAQEYIGTLAHELGHYLGLPDLYDTGSGGGSWSAYDMSYLSLMNYGCYGEDPDRNPIPYSLDIWSRVTLGWVEPVTLDPGEDVSIAGSLNPSEDLPVAVRVNTSRDSEYYLIENRRFSGWDAGMGRFYPDHALSDGEDLGGGLLLWHIDDDIIDEFLSWNSVINSYHRPGVAPLFWEFNGNIQDTIGTSVNTKKAFFDAKLWGSDLAFPLYKADDLISDSPADRTRSGLVFTMKNGSAPVMQVQLTDFSGVYSPPGGEDEDDPGQPSQVDLDDIDLFNINRDALLTVAENLRQKDDSKECIDLIENAKNTILELSYDDDLMLEANNKKVSDIVEQLIIDLREQHNKEQNPEYDNCQKDDNCPITAFMDLDKEAWYHDGVHWALQKEVMNGTGNSTFEPMATTTRAMLVTMLWRMEGSPTVDYELSFTDVPDDSWFTKAIRWAASNGIVNGYNNETFGTNDPVTREQIAAILYRSAQSRGQGFNGGWAFPLQFDDADQVSVWADEAMHWMVMTGTIRGVSDNLLSPKSDASRAQVATMLQRFSEKVN